MTHEDSLVRSIEERNAVVVEYLPLIRHVVVKYEKSLTEAGIDAEDAFQEAVLGVVIGLDELAGCSLRVAKACIRHRARLAIVDMMRAAEGGLGDRRLGLWHPGRVRRIRKNSLR